MAGEIDSSSYAKKISFFCKTFSLFLPCDMAAVHSFEKLNAHVCPKEKILNLFPVFPVMGNDGIEDK